MNREVMDRQMFRYGGGVPMQEGGVPPAPMPMPMPEIDPEQVEMNQAAEGAMQNGIDPAVLEGMLGQYSQQMTGLDSAEDYETVINGIRGDNLPMEARYAELSDLVGPEDAQQTPESVLALLQPVMMLAGADQEAEGVDQGIGGLAQDEMMAPIEGPMAEGIMSTVNMEPPPEEMMVAMGGTTPVNFNQGGAVQYMEHGGVGVPHNLQTTFDERKDIYQSLLGSQAGEYDEQKNMTKAQMLFDIAQGALAFATPGERRMSPAERLAQSFTPVLGNIGARVGELNKFKQAQAKEGRALDVAALGSAEKTLAAEKAAEAALGAARIKAGAKVGSASIKATAALRAAKPGDTYQLKDKEGTVVWEGLMGSVGEKDDLLDQFPEAVAVKKVKDTEASSFVTFINPGDENDFKVFDVNNLDPNNLAAIEKVRNTVDEKGQRVYRVTGNYTRPSGQGTATTRVTLYNATTGETLNPLASDPNIDNLLEDGFEVVNTPARPTTPKLEARTLFVTDSARLAAYADGTLSATETAQLEQIIGEMQTPSTTIVRGQQVTSPSKPLSGPLLKAIRDRMSGGYETTSFTLPKKEDNTSDAILSLRKQPDTGAVITALQDYRSKDKGTLPRDILNSPEFNNTLLDESGRIDLSSESWRMIPTQIYKAGVNYDVARGVSTFPDRVATTFGEIARDIFGGRVSPEGLMIYQADNDFKALKTLTKGRITSAVTEGRVLKSVQDEINKFLDPLQPGVMKFDAKARASLSSIAGILATSLDEQVAILPEYNGDPSLYSNTDIQTARKTARQLRNLLTEYVQFGDQMDSFLSGESGVGGEAGKLNVQDTRNVLYKEALKQQGGKN